MEDKEKQGMVEGVIWLQIDFISLHCFKRRSIGSFFNNWYRWKIVKLILLFCLHINIGCWCHCPSVQIKRIFIIHQVSVCNKNLLNKTLSNSSLTSSFCLSYFEFILLHDIFDNNFSKVCSFCLCFRLLNKTIKKFGIEKLVNGWKAQQISLLLPYFLWLYFTL